MQGNEEPWVRPITHSAPSLTGPGGQFFDATGRASHVGRDRKSIRFQLADDSRHLAVLREAGLVVTERHGQEIRYELNASVFQDLIQHLIDWTRPSAGASRRLSKPARARHQEA